MSMIDVAMGFAVAAHRNQRYGDQQYDFHLRQVVGFVEAYRGCSQEPDRPTLVCGAWLHDVLEDTDVRTDLLRDLFGRKVADLVWAVTDEPGANRAERKMLTYPKIRAAGADAVLLKLADRMANVGANRAEQNKKHLEMYRAEHPTFRGKLYRAGEHEVMWRALDNMLKDL